MENSRHFAAPLMFAYWQFKSNLYCMFCRFTRNRSSVKLVTRQPNKRKLWKLSSKRLNTWWSLSAHSISTNRLSTSRNLPLHPTWAPTSPPSHSRWRSTRTSLTLNSYCQLAHGMRGKLNSAENALDLTDQSTLMRRDHLAVEILRSPTRETTSHSRTSRCSLILTQPALPMSLVAITTALATFRQQSGALCLLHSSCCSSCRTDSWWSWTSAQWTVLTIQRARPSQSTPKSRQRWFFEKVG